MVSSISRLNAIYNRNVLIHDELSELKSSIKKGLVEVVESNRKLNPAYVEPSRNIGAWRKVADSSESDQRPLAKSETDRLLKKLDIL
jgi:hypothetical protein